MVVVITNGGNLQTGNKNNEKGVAIEMEGQIGSQYLGSLSEVQDSGKGDGSVIITIPRQYVEAIGVQVGRRVEITANMDCIFVGSVDRPCSFCGTKTELQLVTLQNGVVKELCQNCASVFQSKPVEGQ